MTARGIFTAIVKNEVLGQGGEKEDRFEVEFSGVGSFNGSSVVFAKPTNNLHRLQFIHDKGPFKSI